ncbi:MAG: hypothetical protein SPE01_03615 [Candidatus Spyradocola sp.]|nr:hypothetical protein [Candidatus Spyradocola sp.]
MTNARLTCPSWRRMASAERKTSTLTQGSPRSARQRPMLSVSAAMCAGKVVL